MYSVVNIVLHFRLSNDAASAPFSVQMTFSINRFPSSFKKTRFFADNSHVSQSFVDCNLSVYSGARSARIFEPVRAV